MIRLAMASLFGGLIGLERERKDWAAGMRTHMMVSVGSCLIMIVSSFGFADILGRSHVTLDPSRVAAQVVSGIGFIGAGAILFSKQGTVRGLTTAAGLWTVAAIGLATGGGLYFAAGATTVIALIILWALQPLERYYTRRFKHTTVRIVTDSEKDNTDFLNTIMNREEMKVKSFSLEKKGSNYELQLTFDSPDISNMEPLIGELKNHPSVKEVSWSQ